MFADGNRSVGFTRVELVAVFLIIGGLVALLYLSVMIARNPKGPHGERIPRAAPLESNRIIHPTRLSIIAPENWDQIRDRGPDVPFLSIAARGTPGRRLGSIITVTTVSPPPDEARLSTFKQIVFQGQPAYEHMQILRKGSFDDPATSQYDLYLHSGGHWWNISFLVADEMTAIPPQIRQYIETVQFP